MALAMSDNSAGPIASACGFTLVVASGLSSFAHLSRGRRHPRPPLPPPRNAAPAHAPYEGWFRNPTHYTSHRLLQRNRRGSPPLKDDEYKAELEKRRSTPVSSAASLEGR